MMIVCDDDWRHLIFFSSSLILCLNSLDSWTAGPTCQWWWWCNWLLIWSCFLAKSNFSCSSVYIANDHLSNMFSCFIAEENWRRGDQRSVLADYATVCFRRYYICKKKIPKHPKCLSILQISALSPSWFHLFATELVDSGWQWLTIVGNGWQ